MNAPTNKPESMALSAAKPPQFDLSPQTFEQALTFANYLADSDMVPKNFHGKPGDCLIAMQWGMEVGLKPLQALQNIAVINGRPSLWGDAIIALVRSSPLCEYVMESQTDAVATCRVKRRGEAEEVRTFSMEDAKKAGLTGKTGPWTQYPKRMMQMRARAFAMRDVFPDVLKGLHSAEESMDLQVPTDMGDVQRVKVTPGGAATAWTAEQLKAARDAAAQGAAAYSRFWKTLDKATAAKLAATPEHADNKERALSADAGRTVDTPAATAAAPTVDAATGELLKSFDEVMAMLCAATNEDALNVAMDWANAINDTEQHDLLEAKYEELLQKMRGAA
jgi:hypothetical protein